MKSMWTLRTLGMLALIVLLGAVGVAPAFADAAVEVGFDVRFSGVITTVGAAGEAWVIGGQTVATDDLTNVILTVSPATPGQWAEVAAAKLDDGSLLAKQITVRPEQVRLRGVVTDIPETTAGAWVIAGVTVNVTEDTRISERSGKVVEGRWVEAVMTEDQGVLTATMIVGIGDQDAVMVSGEIQQFNDTEWVISGIPLSITPDTLISGTPVVGLIGHAAADLLDDGTLVAKVLRVAWIDRTMPPVADFVGEIEALPQVGLRGIWTVDGREVIVLANTRIHQEKGLAVVGATVHVVGWTLGGKLLATEITVISSPEEGGEYVIGNGVIEALPADIHDGIWTISGVKVLVNDNTSVFGQRIEVGKTARYEGVKRAGWGGRRQPHSRAPGHGADCAVGRTKDGRRTTKDGRAHTHGVRSL